MTDSEWLLRDEVAEALGINPHSVAKLYREGKLTKRRKFDRTFAYLHSEVKAYAAKPRRVVTRAKGRKAYTRGRQQYSKDAFCRRCEILLAEMPASPDPTLCDECWELMHPKPRAVAWPVEIVNPAFLRR